MQKIVPRMMSDPLASSSPEESQRITQAVLGMKKLDVRALEQARPG